MTLYWGVRTKADLYFGVVREWARQHHNFTFIPVLSDALPTDNWTAERGWCRLYLKITKAW